MSVFQSKKWLTRKSAIGKLLRWPFDLIPGSAVLPILLGPLAGKKWIKGSHNLSNLMGDYEAHQAAAFVAAAKNSSVMWDLGAHVGYYSLLYLTHSKGFVFAFEPDARNAAFFSRHMKLNACVDFQIFPNAVFNENKMLRFNESRSSVASRISDVGEREVPAVSLRTWLEAGKIRPADLIKMDIEGAESVVLPDLQLFLENHAPVIFLSTHGANVHQQCVSFLEGLGYQLRPLDHPELNRSREVMATKTP